LEWLKKFNIPGRKIKMKKSNPVSLIKVGELAKEIWNGVMRAKIIDIRILGIILKKIASTGCALSVDMIVI
jgi:hypothetical protein